MKASYGTDGGSRPEEGRGAAAVVEIEGVAGPFLYSELLPSATVNESEYAAVILGLEKAAEHGANEVVALTESRLVVEQVRGRWECAPRPYYPCWHGQYGCWIALRLRVGWLPRERNRAAHELVAEVLREGSERSTVP